MRFLNSKSMLCYLNLIAFIFFKKPILSQSFAIKCMSIFFDFIVTFSLSVLHFDMRFKFTRISILRNKANKKHRAIFRCWFSKLSSKWIIEILEMLIVIIIAQWKWSLFDDFCGILFIFISISLCVYVYGFINEIENTFSLMINKSI